MKLFDCSGGVYKLGIGIAYISSMFIGGATPSEMFLWECKAFSMKKDA